MSPLMHWGMTEFSSAADSDCVCCSASLAAQIQFMSVQIIKQQDQTPASLARMTHHSGSTTTSQWWPLTPWGRVFQSQWKWMLSILVS